ncbi:MAG: hypothetical protein JKY09_03980 [Crocinitomicaceae bacterium]|nr:hypothetical protein [Crocinitomicaceae bacterium]
MKITYLTLTLLVALLGSCTSEYEERMVEAKILKAKLSLVKETNFTAPNHRLSIEIKKILDEINFLAKLSGNKEVFLQEVFEN